MSNCFETQDLSVGYSGKIVIHGLDVAIHEGKVTAIIGPNGCGKSTLLKTLARLIRPLGGSLLLHGRNMMEESLSMLSKNLSVLPQSPTAPAELTVRQLVEYGRHPYKRGFGSLSKEDNSIVTWALEQTRLLEHQEHEIGRLSGGQRQRAWIALAIAQRTDVILLDEPTTYLDMAYQLELLQLLKALNLRHQTTIIMVLHDLNLAARFSDFLIAMKEGRIVQQGSVEEIMTAETLRNTFQIEAQILRDQKSGCPLCFSYDLIGKE